MRLLQLTAALASVAALVAARETVEDAGKPHTSRDDFKLLST